MRVSKGGMAPLAYVIAALWLVGYALTALCRNSGGTGKRVEHENTAMRDPPA